MMLNVLELVTYIVTLLKKEKQVITGAATKSQQLHLGFGLVFDGQKKKKTTNFALPTV